MNLAELESDMDALDQDLEEERAALRRVAVGSATRFDAALLAGRLGHLDLFGKQGCVYCGKEVPYGEEACRFACCGEVGHTEEQ